MIKVMLIMLIIITTIMVMEMLMAVIVVIAIMMTIQLMLLSSIPSIPFLPTFGGNNSWVNSCPHSDIDTHLRRSHGPVPISLASVPKVNITPHPIF